MGDVIPAALPKVTFLWVTKTASGSAPAAEKRSC